MLLFADRVDGFGHVPHDVKPIEHNPRLAVLEALTRGDDVGLPHVHRDRLNRGFLLVGQLLVVPGQAVGLALLGHKLHGRALQVAEKMSP